MSLETKNKNHLRIPQVKFSCFLLIAGMGLQCFDCDIESTHICKTKGMHHGRKITCLNGETACAKFVGGMIM